MHDTPAQEFFASPRRDFSMAAFRLEKPAPTLAVWVLHENPGWALGDRRPRGNEMERQISR
jgi:murein L,D-transpeptidase YcbB/YkuD